MNTAAKAAPAIKLKPVTSSQIHSVGHCDQTNRLHVCFHGKDGPGSTHEYSGFTADDLAKFMRAESLGKYFNAEIKNAKHDDGSVKYPHTKLEPAAA